MTAGQEEVPSHGRSGVRPGAPGGGGRFDDDLLDEIRSRCDIVSVIGEYVQLRKRGANLVGLCPFHNEKTPSFTVSPDKQMFYCFGCQTGGNAFTFLMQREGLSFSEAVEHLAGRSGVVLPEKRRRRATPEETVAEERRRSERDLLYRVTEFAARFFTQALVKAPEAEAARRYLARRGIKPGSVEAFRLGYSYPAWDGLLTALRAKGVQAEVLERAGLVLRRKDSGDAESAEGAERGQRSERAYYDRFRNRLMFTICDHRGRPIGFGARALDEADQPKYLNSPETPLFSKGRALYGLHLAAQPIRRGGRALVVEGYMDVITCHEFGLEYAVAAMGTALTPDQARALRRHTDTVVTAFDGDAAGTVATVRGLEVLTTAGFNVKVAEIPGGKDPDECLRTAETGLPAFQRAVDSAIALPEYRFRLALRRHDPSSIEGRVEVVSEILPVLAGIGGPLERQEYLRDFAQRIPVAEDALRAELIRYLRERSNPARRGGSGVRDRIAASRNNKETTADGTKVGTGRLLRDSADPVGAAERTLLACMVGAPEGLSLAVGELLAAANWCREIGLDWEGDDRTAVLGWFSRPGHREMAEALLRISQTCSGPVGDDRLLAELTAGGGDEQEDATLLARLVFEAQAEDETVDERRTRVERVIRDCITVLKEQRLNSRIDELHRRISDLERRASLMRAGVYTGNATDTGASGESLVDVERILYELIREQIDLERHTDGGTGHWKVPGD